MEAEVVETQGNTMIRVVLIKKKQEVAMPGMPQDSPVMSKEGRPKSIKGQIESLKVSTISSEEKQFRKGKLLKNKGYLRK